VAQTKTRVVGQGFTSFNYRGQPIAFLESFSDSGQYPIAEAEPITPLGESHPVEIATGRVYGPGTLTLTIRELWNAPVWQSLVGLAGTDNIVDIYEAIAREPSALTCQMIIKTPSGLIRGKTYQGCVVTRIDDSHTLQINSMTVARSMTITYTHKTAI